MTVTAASTLGTGQPGVWRAWDLTPAQHLDSVRQVESIIARARRRGFTGQVTVAGRARLVQQDDPLLGAREVVVVRSWFEGHPAAYGGWEMLATVESLTGGGTRVHAAAGAARVWDVDQSGVRSGVCERCGTERPGRRVTYLLARPGHRSPVCVGASCLRGFVGVGAPVFVGEWDLAEQLGWGVAGQSWPSAFTVPTVLAYGFAATGAFGWRGARVTSARVMAALSGRGDPATLRTKTALADHIGRGRDWAAAVVASREPDREVLPLVARVAPWGAVTARQVPEVVREIPRLLRHSAAGREVLRGETG